jgi:uncharacterized coiled-coil DUF342 family protein
MTTTASSASTPCAVLDNAALMKKLEDAQRATEEANRAADEAKRTADAFKEETETLKRRMVEMMEEASSNKQPRTSSEED